MVFAIVEYFAMIRLHTNVNRRIFYIENIAQASGHGENEHPGGALREKIELPAFFHLHV